MRPDPRATLLALVSVLALATTTSTHGALTGTVRNSTNTAASAVYANNPTCTSTTRASAAYAVHPLAESGGTSAADVSGNNRPGTYLAIAGITFGATGPCGRDGGRAITLDGAQGQVVSPAVSNPQVFSTEVWFRTTTTRGGQLIGYGSSAGPAASTTSDRALWMSNAGALSFSVRPQGNARKMITSPAAYNDGAWHQAVTTLGSAGAVLYVDGAQVATDTSITSAQTNSGGSWRIGYDDLSAWTGSPTSNYFAGSLAFASTYSTALTPAEVLAHYNARA